MINLSHYQQLFDIENTAERCKRVNEAMDALWTQEMGIMAGELLGADYRIATYGKTLVTTYHDALNPKYAEQKKDTNIGRKYFAEIVRQIGEKETSLLTLEFNGLEKQLYVQVELSFYLVYELIRNRRLGAMLDALEPGIHIYTRTGSFSRLEVERSQLETTIEETVKTKARPWVYFGMSLPLEGQLDEDAIAGMLRELWGQMGEFRSCLLQYRERSARAGHIMNLLASVETPYTTEFFGNIYQIEYEKTGSESKGQRTQSFSLKREGQTVVQGKFFYREYEFERALSRPMLAVDVEGNNNHIYTNVDVLLGNSEHEWWIQKAFRMKDQNNEELKKRALDLLTKHGFHVRENEYRIGTYRNDEGRFMEEAAEVKGQLACAALLFAHVSGRGSFRFPQTEKSFKEPFLGDDIDTKEVEEYSSSFEFSVIWDWAQSSTLTFSKDLIRDLHLNLTAMQDKHFVILSGISGTGKTQLAKLYANAVYGLSYEEENPYLSVIPVRPDWTDGTALFGYYSSFENRYVMTEFLRMLLHAQAEREKPHFIVLDEMNLARVEYYLSDYLSGVESSKEIWLHNRNDLEGIPSKISIPPNIYLIGTINVDETTHSISDKVLDRAFVMTLSDVDLDTFWNRLDDGMKNGLQNEFTYLKRIHGILAPYYLHFGYRTMNEMLQKLIRHQTLDVEHQASRIGMLDQVISEKVLPKLKGDDRIADLLRELKDAFAEYLGQGSVSCGHMIRMEKELLRYGATQFWR